MDKSQRPMQIFLSLILCLLTSAAYAHLPGQSYIFLSVNDQSVNGRAEITLKDLNKVLGLQLPEDGTATMDQILAHSKTIDDYVLEHISIKTHGETSEITIVDHGRLDVSFAQFVRVYFELETNIENPLRFAIDNDLVLHADQTHRSLLVVENNWETGKLDNELLIALTFAPEARRQSLDLSDGSILKGLWAFIKLGMHHIWIGADHVLFLLALLIPSVMILSKKNWTANPSLGSALWQVIKIVTVFTIAHTITLSLAATHIVDLNSRLVESIIALSIAIAALHILLPRIQSHAFWIVLGFGLFHGFGFANILGEMQIPQKYLIWSLLGFNLGVEIGQVAIVAVIVPVLFLLRNKNLYRQILMPAGAFALIGISVYWFIERAFDLDFQMGNSLKSLLFSS